MTKWLSLGLVLTLVPAAAGQLPPEKALQTFTVSEGLEISLFAAEPLFVNPTCIDIDHKGRVWVCESVNYRDTLFHRPLKRPEGDRIVILEDTKGVGRADKATTFYQSKEMLAPLGIAVAKDPVGPGYKVYVCQSPDILVFEDKDGDGKADGPPRKLLTGFRGVDHDHGVHGIFIGPDNRLYFSVGDQGVQNLQSSDGKGRKWTSNETDCRAGTIWRCDLDGKNLELLAHNFRNEYEPCMDSFGTLFVSDNDDDGNQQTRICYVMPGGNYGYHPRGPGQSHWHEEQPGVVPKILRTYFGSPTGMCVYEGTLLPKKYWGQPLHTDAGPRHLRCYHLTPDGAGYAVEREDMVQSTDNWFRPSDVCVAPDGSVFISDWYDPGVGGHGMGDTSRGRIYRITPKGYQGYRVPEVKLDTPENIVSALASPNLATRYLGMQAMRQNASLGGIAQVAARHPHQPVVMDRFMQHAANFIASANDDTKREVIEGLQPLHEVHGNNLDRFKHLLVRRGPQWLRFIGPIAAPGRLAKLEDPAQRRDVLLALRNADVELAKAYLYPLAERYDGKDRFYLEAIGIAVGHDPARRNVILKDFAKHFPTWDDKVADLVWELHPPEMMPLLEKRVVDASLSGKQRTRIVDILASADDAAAGKSLLKVLQGDVPADTREAVVKNLKEALPGKWRNLRDSAELTAGINRLLGRPDGHAAGLALVGAAERKDLLGRVEALAKDAKEAPAARAAAVQTLGLLPSDEAVKGLVALLKTEPANLRVEAVQALGQHVQQKARNPRPGTQSAVKALEDIVLADDHDPAVRHAATEALAGSRPGSEWLLDLQKQKKLPDVVKQDAARVLRNSPYRDLRDRAHAAFPPPGKLNPAKLPPIPALAARRGDPARGKQLLAASVKSDLQCLKCHTVRGVGGQVGPDLSVIGKKASRENLVESILYPSKAIADQFLSWVVETKNGQLITGLLVEEKPDSLTLRDANAKDTKIDKKDVESRTKSPTSIMPSDLLAYMTEEDLVDIVEYLFSLKTPALAMDYWHVLGPFDNGPDDAGLDRAYPPEKGIDRTASYPGKSGPVRWRTVKPDGQGYVDLAAFLGNDAPNSLSYLYREVESPADQEVLLLLGTDDCAKLWVNDKLVYTCRLHRPATPEEDLVKVPLRKGVNKVLLKITNGDGGHGFYFTALAEQDLKRVEEK